MQVVAGRQQSFLWRRGHIISTAQPSINDASFVYPSLPLIRQGHILFSMKENDCDINDTNFQKDNQTFRSPTPESLDTIQQRQLGHNLQPSQVFCLSSKLCKYSHPQAFGFHPTNGPKLVSGMFRLSCPLLVEAIDEWEGEGGVRELSDWLRQKDKGEDGDWKERGYDNANRMQKKIRMELVSDEDREKLSSRLGEYNAKRFLESGVAGIPADQTFNVKCIHAHVADHLCRCSTSPESDASPTSVTDGNIIGRRALEILQYRRGVPINGNDVCWQQCNMNHEQQPTDWNYTPKKNRQKLKSTRQRRRELRDGSDVAEEIS